MLYFINLFDINRNFLKLTFINRRKLSKSKVFVGPGNIAGNARFVASSLRMSGISAKSFSYNQHPFGYYCDHNKILFSKFLENPKERNLLQKFLVNKYSLKAIWMFQKMRLFILAVIKFNTFIFISHETFFKNNFDLAILKLLKKRLHFCLLGVRKETLMTK